MTALNVVNLPAVPELSELYRKQVTKAVPAMVPGLKPKRTIDDPATAFRVDDVCIDPIHLARYCQAVGFRLGNEAPVTYPYALAFPLAVKVMDSPGFPFPAMGIVHLSNKIEQFRPLHVEDTFTINVHAENLRPHRKGLVLDMITSIYVEGVLVWQQTSAFLGPGAKFSSSTPEVVASRPEATRFLPQPQAPAAGTNPVSTLRFSPESTKVYAEASGDKNPIHTSRAGAKLFGFPNTIAHGMYTHASMLTALEGRLPEAVRVQADFYKPVILPAATVLFASEHDRAWTLELRKAKDVDKLHVAAAVESLS
ncbi:MaoC/PaaZ C-terminal domain-containing protein [Corynebacterium striatum]|uniref:MaoC/PaaZ C-terminal domain-containing protein n=1 Tax=Corynebacterium striatum TaxID=43770 RepID=UPI0027BAFB50|nr:MaoC/PaaZ C-terminal domain-containing protein [Corynebacterium striatum]